MKDVGGRDSELTPIIERLREFVSQRNWAQFHDPKSLAMAIASEAGELLAELRWVRSEDSDAHVRRSDVRPDIENEVADVAIALLLFCDRAKIDLVQALHRKIDINAQNYPVTSARGRAERPNTQRTRTANPRIVAVDWSGDARGGAKTVWLAEVVDGQVERLENGRTRAELAKELIEIAEHDSNTVIGLDFAFSFPEWFVRSLGAESHLDLWDAVAQSGEEWLRACESPFWGRPGRANPRSQEAYRQTEKAFGRSTGGQAKSVFQIGGAGAVGTGSIRGMPMLAQLRRAGFSIWPFDEPTLPMAIEIYPRVLTGPVVKSAKDARTLYLESRYPELDLRFREIGAETEDAFDALVSALVMSRRSSELPLVKLEIDSVERVEGKIWCPKAVESVPA